MSPSTLARVAAPVGAACALAALTWLSLLAGGTGGAAVFWLVAASWLAFAVAARLVCRLPERAALRLVVGGGIALQAIAVSFGPRTSTDVYRYAWDGRVGNHGVDPYRYAPDAPQLAGLRVPWLFPPGQAPLINRPDVHTIYPPVGQLWFRLVDALAPPGSAVTAFQVAAALVAVAGTWLLIVVLRGAGADPRTAVLWAWCPLVVAEAGNNAHLDTLAAVLAVAALALVVRRRTALGGVVLGLAIGVKVLPVVVTPAVARRRPLLLLGCAGAVLAASYLPHLLAVGPGVVGFLPGYLSQEGYASGDRFALLRLVVPEAVAPYVAVAVAGVAAWLVWRRADPTHRADATDRPGVTDRADPWAGAATLAGVALLVATPSYPWYGMLLVALAVAAARPQWLAVAAAGYVTLLGGWTGWTGTELLRTGYGLGLAVVVTAAVRRRRQASGVAPGPELSRSGVGEPVAQQRVHEDAGDGAALPVAPGGKVVRPAPAEPDPAGA